MGENFEAVPETNSLDSIDDSESLFADYEAEDTTETETETEETEPQATEEVADNPFLRVKFNGEDRSLNEEEARTLAQKGLNYDRFYEPIERLARMNNMSVGDYVNQLNETQMEFELSKEMDNLREDPKYADLNDDVLREIAEARVKDVIGQKDKVYQDQQKQAADAQQEQVQREIDKFMEEYPEFRNKGPESLDPKVYEYVQRGYTLLEAYNKYLRENVNQSQTDLKAKAAQLNANNKKKALGNTTNAGSVETDAFLDGLNS